MIPISNIMDRGKKEAKEGITLYRDPMEAAKNADVVYTDVWASMGQEAEQEKRKKVFKNYQVNQKLFEHGQKGRDSHALSAGASRRRNYLGRH